jgi:hypothetical protein
MRLTSNMNEKLVSRFKENLVILIVIITISVLSAYIAQ